MAKEDNKQEELVWSGDTNGKCLYFAALIHVSWISYSIVIGAIILSHFFEQEAIFLIAIAVLPIICAISTASALKLHGNLLLTTKFLRFKMGKLDYMFAYDELYSVTVYRSLADKLGGTSSLKVRALLTWKFASGIIAKQSVGSIKLRQLRDAKTAKRVMEQMMAEANAQGDAAV